MFTEFSIAKLFVPGMILLIVLGLMAVLKIAASRWKKIPPNMAGIFYGKKSGKDGIGFRVVSGGGSLQMPFIEDFQPMSTAVFQTEIDENKIPNVDNVRINVNGIATCKISTKQEDLMNAAKAFLGKTEDEIKATVQNILKGHLRSIIGKLDIDAILRKRDEFNQQVIKESSEELTRIGVQILTLVIQDVNDDHGYIEALGRKTVAEAIRDADIKVAEAKKEADIKVSTAQKEAAKVKAENEALIAEANKDRDVKQAQYKATADGELAKANQALAIANAAQEQRLKVAQAERDAAEKEAQILVQQKEAERKQQELEATVVKPAQAAKQKQIIDAEASKQQQILEAEAAKQQQILEAEAAKEVQIRKAEADQKAKTLEGEGEAAKTRAIGEGQAAATKAIGEGEAARTRAIGEGQAAATKATLTAAAEGAAAQKGLVLKAEADGTKALAEAMAQMTEAAKLILILDRVPVLMDKFGDAGSKIAREVFMGCAAPLGNIDELRIIDFGGDGKSVKNLGTLVPTMVMEILTKLRASGVDVTDLASKLGIDISKIAEFVNSATKNNLAKAEDTQ
ncbi:MAG: SPFH domain-containing protein [Candidatus Nanoarchaeia archaeon]